jgi:hypothetical protein
MAEISDETLEFIVKRAKSMHHGSITIHINSDAPSKVDLEVVDRARFHTDDRVEASPKPFLKSDRATSTTSNSLRAG